MRRGFVVGAGAALLLGACSAKKPHPPGGDGGSPIIPSATAWNLADLGPGRCVSVNDRGQALGTDDSDATFIAAIGQGRAALGPALDGSTAVGVAINADGQVVGYSQSNDARTALVYRGGQWQTVAGLSGAWSSAVSLDDAGDVVGMSGDDANTQMQAFFVKAGALTDLQLSAPNSAAYQVTNAGQVAGIFQTTASDTHAFVKDASGFHDLGTLGGANSTPYAMSARGDVVGAAETGAGPRHAFLAASGGTLTDLGIPENAVSSEARGISEPGQIAGNLYDVQHVSHPVVFVPGAPPIDLPTVPGGAHVVGMSPAGNIVGWAVGVDADAGTTGARCLLWTPKGGS